MSVICYRADFAGRDEEYVPVYLMPGVRYLCFTDKPTVPKPWQAVRPVRYFSCPRKTSLWHKMHPHEVLPEHEISVFLNASVGIKQDITPLLELCRGSEQPIGPSPRCTRFLAHRHRHRNCLFDEAKFCVEIGVADEQEAREQLARYRRVRREAGLWESGVLIRGLSGYNQAINEMWWREIEQGTDRDQVSLAFLQSICGHITDLPGNFDDSEYFYVKPHGGPLPADEAELKERFPGYYRRRQAWSENVRQLLQAQGDAVPAV